MTVGVLIDHGGGGISDSLRLDTVRVIPFSTASVGIIPGAPSKLRVRDAIRDGPRAALVGRENHRRGRGSGRPPSRQGKVSPA